MNDFEKIVNHEKNKLDKPSLRDRWEMRLNDLLADEPRMWKRYFTAYAAVSILAVGAAVVYEEVTPDSYQEKLERQYDKFLECASTQDLNDVKLRIAFPEHPVDEAVLARIDQCRQEHPMPQKEK